MENPIPHNLRRFYEPQLEQMHAQLVDSKEGLLASLSSGACEGELWAFSLGSSCLVTMHTLRVKRPTLLVEEPGTYACVCCGTQECFDGAPVARPAHTRTTDNLFTFAQGEERMEFELEPGASYTSRSICLAKDFPRCNPDLWPAGFEQLAAGFNLLEPNSQAREIRPLMRLVHSTSSRDTSASRRAGLAARQAVRAALADAAVALRAHRQAGSSAQHRLAEQAKLLVRSNLDEPFTLDALAQNLLVSRSTLCAAFKEETGESLGAFTQDERMRAACDMLANSHLPVAAVAEHVGYKRQGSFTDAFKAHTGQTPTAWRRKH